MDKISCLKVQDKPAPTRRRYCSQLESTFSGLTIGMEMRRNIVTDSSKFQGILEAKFERPWSTVLLKIEAL